MPAWPNFSVPMPRDPLTLFLADATADEPLRVGRAVDGKPNVAPLAVTADATPDAVAAAVAALARGPVTLALPSSACLAATIDTAGVSRSGWAYRLELAVPLSAEEMAADFLPHPRVATALGVAVAIADVRPWVDALERAGLTVAAVCPAALLAIESSTARDGCVAWGHGSAVDLIVLTDGAVERWFTLPGEPDDVQLYRVAVAGRAPVRAIDTADAVADAIGATERVALDWSTAATAAVLSGRRPRVDLGRGGLTAAGSAGRRRSSLRLAVAAVACGGCVIGAAVWRASRYQSLADAELDRQAAVYRDLYPNRPVPADVRSRLASEARAAGTGAVSTTEAGHPALALLHGLLSHLPAEAKFRLTDVRVADGTVSVEGTAATRADANAVADGVRAGTGLPIDTPRTDRVGPHEVRFSVAGTTANPETADRGTP